jgi:isoamylase
MATLLLSQGIPMLRAGDELSHTQQGNNNAYCQDNELNWLHWELDDRSSSSWISWQGHRFETLRAGASSAEVLPGTAAARHRRERYPVARSFGRGDVRRRLARGLRAFAIGVRLNGNAIYETDEQGRTLVGNTLLLLFNADANEISFALPAVDG